MKLEEMKVCAADTLKFFIETMPDVPFTADDVVFVFAKEADLAKRAVELCAEYCPDKILNESQLQNLEESILANALIGREKSAVLIRLTTLNKKAFRQLIIHELTHIFCGKLEGSKGFIDIYGSGTAYEKNPEDKTHDGIIVAGHDVWSEFIAQYYAVKLIDTDPFTFEDIAHNVHQSLLKVNVLRLVESKKDFSWLCSYWFNCEDFEESLAELSEPGTFIRLDLPYGEKTQKALFDCVEYIFKQMQKNKPWEINEDFIYGLGSRFMNFRLAISICTGLLV